MFPENIKEESEDDPEIISFEHIIKIEPEAFADSVVSVKTEETTIDCKLDVGPKALDFSMGPFVVLKLLDEAIVAFDIKPEPSNPTKIAQKPRKRRLNIDPKVPCKVCGIKRWPGALRSHMLIHESKKECPKCHKFVSLRSHLRRCQKEIECGQCGEVLKGKKALRRHKLTAHFNGRLYYCHCGEVFENNNNLYVHRTGVHSTERFPCTRCDKSYGGRPTLIQHWRKLHEKEFGPFDYERTYTSEEMCMSEAIYVRETELSKLKPQRRCYGRKLNVTRSLDVLRNDGSTCQPMQSTTT